jgi:hypothetical protein
MSLKSWMANAYYFSRYVAQAWKHPENIVGELSPRP